MSAPRPAMRSKGKRSLQKPSSWTPPRFFDGNAPERARIVRVDQRRRVQQGRIVPDNHIADAVFQSVLILRLGRVLAQLIEQLVRLFLGHALDAERGAADGIERRAAGDRMPARDLVL